MPLFSSSRRALTTLSLHRPYCKKNLSNVLIEDIFPLHFFAPLMLKIRQEVAAVGVIPCATSDHIVKTGVLCLSV